MCGRISIALSTEDMIQVLRTRYDIDDEGLDFSLPRYNVAPSTNVISIINDGEKNRVGSLRWGFIPFWAQDEKIAYKMINAKGETLSTKASFKHSYQKKRCVILADGFYEWKKEKTEKQPYRFQVTDQSILPLAGLWSSYTRENGEKLYTCTIITTEPNEIMKPIHNRMPVILTPENEKKWLNPKITDFSLLDSLLIPYSKDKMKSYEVSKIVNSPRNQSPECILPIS